VKFTYEYRTSDNVRHEGVVEASDREAAFQRLKAQGIKPGRLAEAPGFFNKLFGKGKRWIAIGFLALLCLVLYVAFFKSETQLEEWVSPLDDGARRQIIGDTAEIELGIKTGWSAVFSDEGDQFLASFAIPGVPAGRRNVPEDVLAASLAKPTVPSSDDTLEARQMKAMVGGMKREINALVAQGWTLAEVGAALAKRQDQEISYYDRAKNELDVLKASGADAQALIAQWQASNEKLRKMGIKPLPLPE